MVISVPTYSKNSCENHMSFQMVMEKTNLKSKARFFLKPHALNKFVGIQFLKNINILIKYLLQKIIFLKKINK